MNKQMKLYEELISPGYKNMYEAVAVVVKNKRWGIDEIFLHDDGLYYIKQKN